MGNTPKSLFEETTTMTTQTTQNLVNQKLEAFERLLTEFEMSFQYVQDMHGQRRFPLLSVADSVHYLHALWICECKDRLLSIYKNITRYEGRYCLELLQRWQEGETADVVAFLQRKLDTLPFSDLTYQIQQARQRGGMEGLTQRLVHGRLILLNRGMNLMNILDAIFALPEYELLKEVQIACRQYGHQPDQIEKQLAELETPLYSYLPHQALAQRNMAVMNKLGVNVITMPSDQPGQRSWRVLEPTEPMHPYAEHLIEGYLELTLPAHNNIMGLRFIDLPERSDVERI
jgi:hypothetical protein